MNGYFWVSEIIGVLVMIWIWWDSQIRSDK